MQEIFMFQCLLGGVFVSLVNWVIFFFFPCSELYDVLLGEWEGMGHDFGIWGGCLVSVSKLGDSLTFFCFFLTFPKLGNSFVVVV